jgi:hypothetical protein
MMMYNRNGGIDVADIDAIATCQRHPNEWTLKPWIRPDGRPDVFIRPDWAADVVGTALLDLARTTFPDNGRGIAIDNAAQAIDAINEYLAGTQHPTAGLATAPATLQ